MNTDARVPMCAVRERARRGAPLARRRIAAGIVLAAVTALTATGAPAQPAPAPAPAAPDAGIRPQLAMLMPDGPGPSMPQSSGGAFTRPSSPGSAVPAFPYVDQVIDEGQPNDPSADEKGDATQEPEGFRSTVIEPSMYLRRSSLGGAYDETGLYVQHRRETVNWGELIVEGAMRHTQQDASFAFAQGGGSARFTLRQAGMPLADGASLTNVLGLFRTLPAEALRSSFRFNLPGSLLSGVASYRNAETGSVQFEHGELTQLEGLQGLGTRRLDGQATSVAFGRSIDDDWSVGAQAVSVRSRLEAGDYTAWTGAVNHGSFGSPLRWKAQFLADNRGRSGEWLEGEWKEGFHGMRGGAWRFDPSIHWFSTLLSSGQRGGALRYDYSDRTLFMGAGLESTRSDAFAIARSPTDAMLVSLNGGYRLDRTRTVGMTGQLRNSAPQFDDGFGMKYRYSSFTLYGTSSSEQSTDRLQVAMVGTSGPSASRVQELSWTRDLTRGDDSSVGMTLGVAQEESDDRSRLRPAIGASYVGPVLSRGRLATWLRYARETERYSSSYSLSGTAQLSWRLDSEWSTMLSANLNRLAFDNQQAYFGALPVKVNERSLWFTLRYAFAGGKPLLGDQPGEGRGAGSVQGFVFMDEDRDGTRSSGEKPASGVTVWLDDILSVTTGADGSFEFRAVRVGRHTVRVDGATVRLPWGAAEERGRPVGVQVRDAVRVDLPLVKVGE